MQWCALCGKTVATGTLARHEASQKHQALVLSPGARASASLTCSGRRRKSPRARRTHSLGPRASRVHRPTSGHCQSQAPTACRLWPRLNGHLRSRTPGVKDVEMAVCWHRPRPIATNARWTQQGPRQLTQKPQQFLFGTLPVRLWLAGCSWLAATHASGALVSRWRFSCAACGSRGHGRRRRGWPRACFRRTPG
jgi:hypothetical protein